jgi:hypothetical protein
MKKKSSIHDRPNVSTVLWWDWDYEKMNFRKAHIAVITRIIEKGTEPEWEEMIRFYGLDQVVHDLKSEIWFLTYHAIDKVCNYFSLTKEEIKCFTYRQSHPNYWH